CSQPRVSGRIDRGGRNGWVGQEHAALFAEAVAGNRRIPAAFYGVEFLAAGEICDAARETAAFADADDVFAAACRGFCRPLRAADHAVVAGRLPGACGSLHLHGICAGCGARLPGALAAKPVPVRAGSRHHVLFPRASGRGGASHPERASKAEILRSGHGFGDVVRPGGEFPAVPGTNLGGVRQDGGHRQFRGAGRHATAASTAPPAAGAKTAAAAEDASSQFFFGEPLVGVDPSEITGNLIVIEGMDGSGRSTQIALLQEWLESEGFAVQTSGLRRSNLVGRDIDELLAKNAATRLTLALMYATDFFDQMEHRILPALRSGTIVLADRFIFTLIARGVVRGINRDYMGGLYAMALRPHLTFWLNVRPETAFGREFKKAQAISYWEAGRDMSLSHDLYWSFIRYQ